MMSRYKQKAQWGSQENGSVCVCGERIHLCVRVYKGGRQGGCSVSCLFRVDFARFVSTCCRHFGAGVDLVDLASLFHIWRFQSDVCLCVYPRRYSSFSPLCELWFSADLKANNRPFPLSRTHLPPPTHTHTTTWGKVLCKTHLFLMDFLMNFLAAY